MYKCIKSIMNCTTLLVEDKVEKRRVRYHKNIIDDPPSISIMAEMPSIFVQATYKNVKN